MTPEQAARELNGAQDVDELQLALDRARAAGYRVTINNDGQYEVTE